MDFMKIDFHFLYVDTSSTFHIVDIMIENDVFDKQKEYTGDYELPPDHMKTTFKRLVHCFNMGEYTEYSELNDLILDIGTIYAQLRQFPDIDLLMEISKDINRLNQDYETIMQIFSLPIMNTYRRMKKKKRFIHKKRIRHMSNAYMKEGETRKKKKRKQKRYINI